MPFESPSQLAQVGLRPEGTGPSSPFETIIKAGGQFIGSYFDQQEKENKKAKDKLEYYITLRKAGYSESAATGTVLKDGYPRTAPEIDVYGEEAAQAGLKTEKMAAEIETEKSKKNWYDTGRTTPQNKERQQLFDELDAGTITYEDLNPAQRKLLYGYTEKTDSGELPGGTGDTGDTGTGTETGTTTSKNGPIEWLAGMLGRTEAAFQKGRSGGAKSTQPKVPTKKSETRDQIINEAWAEHPEKKREEIVAALVKKGLIE